MVSVLAQSFKERKHENYATCKIRIQYMCVHVHDVGGYCCDVYMYMYM